MDDNISIMESIRLKRKAEEDRLKQLEAQGYKRPPPVPRPLYEDLHHNDRSAVDNLYNHAKAVSIKYGNSLEIIDDENYLPERIMFNDSIADKNRFLELMSYESYLTEGQSAEPLRIRSIILRHNFAKQLTPKEYLFDSVPESLASFENLNQLIIENPLFETIDLKPVPTFMKLIIRQNHDYEKVEEEDKLNVVSNLHSSVFFSNLRTLSIFNQSIGELINSNLYNETSKLVEIRIVTNKAELKIDNFAKLAQNFQNLRFIGFSNCNLKVVPNGLGKLKNLMTLNLDDNPLENIAEDLADAPKLGTLLFKSEKLNSADLFYTKFFENILKENRVIDALFLNALELKLPEDDGEKLKVSEMVDNTLKMAEEIILREITIDIDEFNRRKNFYLEEYKQMNQDLGYNPLFDWKNELRFYPTDEINYIEKILKNRLTRPQAIEEYVYFGSIGRLRFSFGSIKLKEIRKIYQAYFDEKYRYSRNIDTLPQEELQFWLENVGIRTEMV
jgi:Leucine-rich repeat (LRR) protein